MRLFWFPLCGLLAGCHGLLPLVAAPDSEVATDGPLVVDAAPAQDVALDELLVADAPALEASPDGPGMDATPKDLPVALDQTAKDTSNTTPCTNGKPPTLTYGATMKTCTVSPQANQCDAHKGCNQAAGWTICTASQFLVRGGKLVPSSAATPGAWIKGCVRHGDGPAHAPTDKYCDCVGGTGTVAKVKIQWNCADTWPFTTTAANMGLRTGPACHRVGTNDPSTEAYWRAQSSPSPGNEVVCCK
jgi:hypothetical protein